MSRSLASIGDRARMPPRARPCVADRLGRRLGTIRDTSRSARRNESVADETSRGAFCASPVPRSSTIRLKHTFYKHSIATSRCRKTEWLLCGAHASSVLAARFALVLDGKQLESSRLPNAYSTNTSGGGERALSSRTPCTP